MMPPSSEARAKPDPLAIGSKGKQTSQIVTQTSGDKPVILSANEEL